MDHKKLIERLRTESLYKDKATPEIMDLWTDPKPDGFCSCGERRNGDATD